MAQRFLNELVESIDKPLSISNRLLGQCDGVGLHFYTINFARMAMQDIHIGSQGQRLYNHCLNNLPLVRTADPRLQMAWSEEHLLRNHGVNLFEYEHLLLASALSEYLSEPYAAAVFSEMAARYEDDTRQRPALSSFRNFVRCANGILATSEFPCIVDDRIRLNPYRTPADGVQFAKQPQESLSVVKVAEALVSLNGKNGDQSDLVIAGGDVVGWFSAYAEICLGIDTTIQDEDGNELHRANAGDGRRLKLRFTRLNATPMSDIHIWLRDTTASPQGPTLFGEPIHSGRVPLDVLFTKSFGRAFQHLAHSESKTFANALGGLARVWELLVADDDISPDVINCDNKSNTASYGLGLINTWSTWFPELRHVTGRMERALKRDKDEASELCESSITRLEPLCSCYICSETVGPDSAPQNIPMEGFCLPTLMETVVMLGLSLSRVALTPNLYPSRAGLIAMYNSQVRKRLVLKAGNIDRHGWQRHILLFGEDWNSTFPKRIFNALAMFAGSWPTAMDRMPENLVAMSHEGIAAYSMMLEKGTRGGRRSKDDQVIRVVTGSLCFGQRVLRKATLGKPVYKQGTVGSRHDTVEQWERLDCQHLDLPLYVSQ